MLNRLKHDTLSNMILSKNMKVCVSQERCVCLSLQYLKSSAKIVVTLRVSEIEKLRAGEVEGGREEKERGNKRDRTESTPGAKKHWKQGQGEGKEKN